MGKRSKIIQGNYILQEKLSEITPGNYKLNEKFHSNLFRGNYQLGKQSSYPVRGNYKLDPDIGLRVSKKIRGNYRLVSAGYFSSMHGNLSNTPGEPTGEEFRGYMRYRASVVCPELGTEYDIPPEDLLGPLAIEDGQNSEIKFGFSLLNKDKKYSKNSGDFQDLITEGYISFVRNTTKFIKLHALSICGEEYKIERFPGLVIKSIQPAQGGLVLRISGRDFLSDVLLRSKDWPAIITEVSCSRINPDALPTWEANKEYKVGDIIQPPSSWNWILRKTLNIHNANENSYVPANAPFLGGIPTTCFYPIVTTFGDVRIFAYLNFNQDGVNMITYPKDFIRGGWEQNDTMIEKLFEGELEPETYQNNQIMFFSTWAYPRESTRAFRCINAGTSGSSSPNWKPFSLDFSRNSSGNLGKMAWASENIEGDAYSGGNLGYSDYQNWGLNPPNILKNARITDVITDGTCQWEAFSYETNPFYQALNITKKEYNRYLGSQVYVNWIEKFPPEDFLPDATTGTFEFTEYFDANTSVNFINPLPAKWLIKYVIDKALDEAFSYSKISKPEYELKLDFLDFLIYNNIQVSGKQANQILKEILEAFGGQFHILSFDGEKLCFQVDLTPLYTEIVNARADFAIPEKLLRACSSSEKNFERVNTINVIRPGKVRKAVAQIQ